MFKTMDPDTIRDLVRGVPDALTPKVEEEAARYKNLRCPMCYEAGCSKVVRQAKVTIGAGGAPQLAVSPFGEGPLPEGHARCVSCSTEFDPDTGIIYKTSASRIHAPPEGSHPE